MDEIVRRARALGASDIHITQGLPLRIRVNGQLQDMPDNGDDVMAGVLSLISPSQRQALEQGQDLDFAFETADGRQRVNIFRQQSRLAATIRLLNAFIPSIDALGLPPVLQSLAEQPAGLVLVTGPTGSGKSTTLAALLQHINSTRPAHIITIEDPIEYQYSLGKALIHQRELGRDTPSFASALRSALREDPDVILVGEMRDYETISAAITAAETGHLVFSTLHTIGAAQTIDRIIDVCPAGIQGQIRSQLSSILRGVVTQKLLPLPDQSGRCVVTEVLIGIDPVLNLIREGKCHQLSPIMQSNGGLGMHTMNSDLARLVREGRLTREMAMLNSLDRRDLEQFL